MRFAAFLVAALAAPAAGQPDTRDQLNALEKKLVAAHAAVRASVGCVGVSRSDKYPNAKPLPPDGRLGGFDPKAFRAADPSPAGAELAARLDLSDPQAVPALGAAGGVVIDPAGLVLTTYGAIDGATKIYVRFAGGGSYADIHAADARSDLAVLKLLTPPPGLAAIPLADVRLPDGRAGAKPNVPPGKLVFVAAPYTPAGRPGGGLGALGALRRVTSGATQPTQTRSYYYYGPTLELDARNDPGCSGAAVLTLDGELLGLTTTAAGLDGDGGRVLPLDANLRRVVDVLRRGEEVEYGFLGVGPNPAAGGRGVEIGQLTPGGPAEAAGLVERERVLRINGYPAQGFEDLLLYVGSALAGNTITLDVLRGGKAVPVPVVLGKFRNDAAWVASVKPDPILGLRVEPASVLAQGVFGAAVPAGVLVREVVPGGPAAARFKALGDTPGRWLVTHVDGAPTNSPAEFRAAGKGRKAAKLTVLDAADMNARPREITIP